MASTFTLNTPVNWLRVAKSVRNDVIIWTFRNDANDCRIQVFSDENGKSADIVQSMWTGSQFTIVYDRSVLAKNAQRIIDRLARRA